MAGRRPSPAVRREADLGRSGGALLEGRGLHLQLGTTRAVQDVTFAVPVATSVAILGPSGSGKSSLLHCLAGVLRPTAGEVWLGGRRIDDLPDDQLSAIRARRFGFVFQFGELLPELSLAENVALPLRLRGESPRPAAARAGEMLGAVGIGELGDRRPFEVSGGQLQRAAVARAVVHRPTVVFADEPTGALDQANGEQVLDVLFDITVSTGAALVMVTHDERMARRAHRIVRVADGRIVTDDAVPGRARTQFATEP